MSWFLAWDDDFTNSPVSGSRSVSFPTSVGSGANSTTGVGNGWVDSTGNIWNLPSSGSFQGTDGGGLQISELLRRPSGEDAVDSQLVFTGPAIDPAFPWYFFLRSNADGSTSYRCQVYGGAMYLDAVSSGSVTSLAANFYTMPGGASTMRLEFEVTGSSGSLAIAELFYDGVSVRRLSPSSDSAGPQVAGCAGVSVRFSSAYTIAGRIQTYTASAPAGGITIASPLTHQVFQRSGTAGDIAISGAHSDASSHDIDASFNGGSYATIASSVATGSFTGTLSAQAQGEGTLTLRFADDHATTATVTRVGIGDVYAILGQSNASGRLGANQSPKTVYTDTDGTSNGISGGQFDATTYLGTPSWRAIADPTGKTQEAAGVGGSYWPLLATRLMVASRVPIGIINAAVGSTTIADWLPGAGAGLYTNAATQITGGVPGGQIKGVLWHQGEGDSGTGTSTYQSRMATLSAAVASDYGCKLIPCKLQSPSTGWSSVNTAIGNAWASDANVLAGPDLSPINGDGTHLYTDADAEAAADLWATALVKAIYDPPTGGTGSISVQSIMTFQTHHHRATAY